MKDNSHFRDFRAGKERPKLKVRNLMQKQLKLPAAAFKDNTLSRVDQQGGSVLFFHYSLVCIEGNFNHTQLTS